MHTCEGGGVDSRKVAGLTRNWTIQSTLTSRSEEGEEDTELIGLEDITAEKLDAEFDWLQLAAPRSSKREPAANQAASPPSPPDQCETHEVYNLMRLAR